MNKVNEKIALTDEPEKNNDDENPPSSNGGSSLDDDEGVDCKKSGKLILDAACTPADIQYPTDTRLLNDAPYISIPYHHFFFLK